MFYRCTCKQVLSYTFILRFYSTLAGYDHLMSAGVLIATERLLHQPQILDSLHSDQLLMPRGQKWSLSRSLLYKLGQCARVCC